MLPHRLDGDECVLPVWKQHVRAGREQVNDPQSRPGRDAKAGKRIPEGRLHRALLTRPQLKRYTQPNRDDAQNGMSSSAAAVAAAGWYCWSE